MNRPVWSYSTNVQIPIYQHILKSECVQSDASECLTLNVEINKILPNVKLFQTSENARQRLGCCSWLKVMDNALNGIKHQKWLKFRNG